MAACVEIGYPMSRPADEAWPHFRGWRVNYEGVAYALAAALDAPPARWSGPRRLFRAESLEPVRPVDRQPTAGTRERAARLTPESAGPGGRLSARVPRDRSPGAPAPSRAR